MATRTSGARSANRGDRSADGKETAGKGTGPAMAAGAAVVGLLVLKRRRRRRKVLGLTLPRSAELELSSLARTIGEASKEFGKASKRVSKDIERLGDQAERIGKMLS